MAWWTHRRGQLLLLLVLPDSTRSLIPGSWTGLRTGGERGAPADDQQASLVADIVQLLHARTVVDALLRRLGASDAALGRERGERGRATDPVRDVRARDTTSVAHSTRGRAWLGDRHPDSPDGRIVAELGDHSADQDDGHD